MLNDPTLNFTLFRTNLIGLTDVTRQFFDRLVQQLERGLGSMKVGFLFYQIIPLVLFALALIENVVLVTCSLSHMLLDHY